MRFNGDSMYGEGGTDKNLGTGDFSIAFWVRIPSRDNYGEVVVLDKRVQNPYRGYHLVIRDGSPLIQLADGGPWNGWYNYDSEIPAWAILDEEWHFLVVTVQRASRQGIRWYLDGIPAGLAKDPTDRQGSLSNEAPLLVGRHAFSISSSPGELDELQILNRVLSPNEVSTQFTRYTTCQ
ncbi:MAG: LamG domain-containing protein [Gemmatimonadetes bacterium]|nr:LamG domain-containing protein [Gemmatimonadota bacterium]